MMQEVDRIRATTVYPHPECSEECKKRGKGEHKYHSVHVAVMSMTVCQVV